MATIRKLKLGKWNVQTRARGKLFACGSFVTRSCAENSPRYITGTWQEHPLLLDAGLTYCHHLLARTTRPQLICSQPLETTG